MLRNAILQGWGKMDLSGKLRPIIDGGANVG
jgi:hypothetical protein